MEHPLVKLAHEISWEKMEQEFAKLFSEQGRPSVAIRKIAGMLLLKEMFKESDETVVERWMENAYWQYFTGETFFQTEQPFDPSNFVHFRKRIGEEGLEFILGQSVSLHPKAKTEDEVQIDTTVQEKNIAFPTDAKLAKKVIDNCVKIAEKEGVAQRQSYKRVSKQLLRDAYFGHHPRRQKKANMAKKKLRTIGKRVLRELERKLPPTILQDYEEVFRTYLKALTQERNTKDKIYSIVVRTQVEFQVLSLRDMEDYWATGEPLGKAGAYAIQGIAARYIPRIDGSYSNVVGLPLHETAQLLQTVKALN